MSSTVSGDESADKLARALRRQTLQKLHGWCANLKVQYSTTMTKAKLVDTIMQAYNARSDDVTNRFKALQQFFVSRRVPLRVYPLVHVEQCAIKIQRFYRQYVKGVMNKEDLNLQAFTGPTFRHVVNMGQVYRFVPKQLSDYFLISGVFRNPYTCQEFNPVELKRLTTMIRQKEPEFEWDFTKDEHLRAIQRRALERTNLQNNIELHETLARDIMNQIYAVNASFAVHMRPAMLDVYLTTWNPGIVEMYENVFVLFRLDRRVSDALVNEFCAKMQLMAEETQFSTTFRTFAAIISTNMSTMYEYFKTLAPDQMPEGMLPFENLFYDEEDDEYYEDLEIANE
jgi:hypothetical protein